MPIAPEMRVLFRNLESKYGLPEGYLSGSAAIESHFDPNAHRPGSQFMGMFQLGEGVRNTYHVSNPYDVNQNAEAAAQYARDNARILHNKLGRDPSAGELYMAHQQGATGASKLLANPTTPAGSLVGNKFVSANGGDPAAPASVFTERFTNKFTGGRSPIVDYVAAKSSTTPITGPELGIGSVAPTTPITTTPPATPGPLTPSQPAPAPQPTQVAKKEDPAFDEVSNLLSSFRSRPTPAEATQMPAPQMPLAPNPMEAQLAIQQRINSALQKLNAMRR